MKTIEATCPGTCGELLEGAYQGHQVLVSLPINIFSKARISERGGRLAPSDWAMQVEKIQTIYPKSWSAFQSMASWLGHSLSIFEGLDIDLSSDLPRGKGMSSSTADMVALMGAGAGYLDHKAPSAKDLTRLCQKFEATDSNLFPSLTLMDEDDGSLVTESCWSPDFSILVLEPDQALDTQGFYGARVTEAFNRQEGDFRQALALYQEAVREKSLDLLGQASLLSAQLNQAIAPKPYFDGIQSLARDFPVFGLVAAHSGTVLGLLVRDGDRGPGLEEDLAQGLEQLGARTYYQKIYWAHSCYNGLEIRSCGGEGLTC